MIVSDVALVTSHVRASSGSRSVARLVQSNSEAAAVLDIPGA